MSEKNWDFIRHYKLQRDRGWRLNSTNKCYASINKTEYSTVLYFYTLWNSPLVLPWIQWLQVCCNVQSLKWKGLSVYIIKRFLMHQEALQCSSEPIRLVLWWELYIAERLGNSQCIQGTGIDSELWLIFPGEVVKSLNSEVILGYTWIKYWLFPMYVCVYT